MKLSKVYRGYVIEQQDNGQWMILNSPSFTNSSGFSPGPHNGWSVAVRQVDKLHEYLNRQNDMNRGKYVPRESPRQEFHRSSSETDDGDALLGFVMVCLFILGWYIALKG